MVSGAAASGERWRHQAGFARRIHHWKHAAGMEGAGILEILRAGRLSAGVDSEAHRDPGRIRIGAGHQQPREGQRRVGAHQQHDLRGGAESRSRVQLTIGGIEEVRFAVVRGAT